MSLFEQFAAIALKVGHGREPDFVIGDADRPYLRRWWLIPRNPVANIYLHQIVRSDDDRALHDHPWLNLSVILAGSYVEHSIAAGGVHRRVLRRAGSIKARHARDAHRLELTDGACWTLFLTGPRFRTWGFHCPETGWTRWQDFTTPGDYGKVGRGCGEASS